MGGEVQQLWRDERLEDYEAVLLMLVDATEAESREKDWGVAPWYYEQLAILYRKQKRYQDEVLILERYGSQKKAAGAKPAKLKE